MSVETWNNLAVFSSFQLGWAAEGSKRVWMSLRTIIGDKHDRSPHAWCPHEFVRRRDTMEPAPLGPGGLHVIRPDDLRHGGAGHADHLRCTGLIYFREKQSDRLPFAGKRSSCFFGSVVATLIIKTNDLPRRSPGFLDWRADNLSVGLRFRVQLIFGYFLYFSPKGCYTVPMTRTGTARTERPRRRRESV